MEKQWFNKQVKDVETELGTDLEKGLSNSQVEEHKSKYGLNELQEKKKESLLKKFIDQFKDFSIIVLIIAAIVSGVVGVAQGEGFTDTIVILVVVFINAITGFIQEEKANSVIDGLKKYEASTCKVKRNGKIDIADTSTLVPGDIIFLEAGDMVPADSRIITCENLKVDESPLTGESIPVIKTNETLNNNLIIQDQKNMIFLSSNITNGKCMAVVINTGMNTEIGKIASSLNKISNIETPLQIKIKEISKNLTIIVFIIMIFIFIFYYI